MSVRFRFEWVDAPPSPDDLARRTMAELCIELDGAVVTAVIDRRSRVYRDHVVVPLLHVAEWLVSNWYHIFHEIEATGEQKPDFEARHNLAFAGDGFVLPSLTMFPASERMHLRWVQRKPCYTQLQFVDAGEVRVRSGELEDQFGILIDAVLDKLRIEGVAFGSVGDAWEAINRLEPDEREFSRAAALLGVDPFDVGDSLADAIVAFWEEADPSLRDDALAAADASSLPCVHEWLRDRLAALEGAGDGGEWATFRQSLAPTAPGTPWAQGYDLARAVRAELGTGNGRYDFASSGPFSFPHSETQPPSTRIQGLVATNTPACVTTPRGECGRRFLLARALGDYLGRSEHGASILSSLATDRQARSRAFAAELLAPAESLREWLSDQPIQPERVDDLSHEFGVSSLVIRHQIENHHLATFAES